MWKASIPSRVSVNPVTRDFFAAPTSTNARVTLAKMEVLVVMLSMASRAPAQLGTPETDAK